MGRSRKPLGSQGSPGFESRPCRQLPAGTRWTVTRPLQPAPGHATRLQPNRLTGRPHGPDQGVDGATKASRRHRRARTHRAAVGAHDGACVRPTATRLALQLRGVAGDRPRGQRVDCAAVQSPPRRGPRTWRTVGALTGSPFASDDLVKVGAGAGEPFGQRVDVDLEGERAAVLVAELRGDVGGRHASGGQERRG